MTYSQRKGGSGVKDHRKVTCSAAGVAVVSLPEVLPKDACEPITREGGQSVPDRYRDGWILWLHASRSESE